MPKKLTSHARERRMQKTRSEGLLWSVLRARQLCGLKFRREHPIGCFVVDFVCYLQRLIVEIDGGYHDETVSKDLRREKLLRGEGWDLIRFSDKEVEEDAESVGRAIAKHLGLGYSFQRRGGGGSGSKAAGRLKAIPSPKPRSSASTLPKEGEDFGP